MQYNTNITQARIYVGTYKKYNEGSLYGTWLDLADYTDSEEFYEACRKLHADEEDPEFMFQDYENIPEHMIHEVHVSKNIFEVIQGLQDIDEDKHQPFFIWCSNANYDLASSNFFSFLQKFEEDYVGYYESEEDYAREAVDQQEDLSNFAKMYFDYEAYASDLFSSDYWFENGYVFSNT